MPNNVKLEVESENNKNKYPRELYILKRVTARIESLKYEIVELIHSVGYNRKSTLSDVYLCDDSFKSISNEGIAGYEFLSDVSLGEIINILDEEIDILEAATSLMDTEMFR